MNKFVKSDLEQSSMYMKIAIMNALHDIDIGDENEISLGKYISLKLLYECLIKAGWKEAYDSKISDSYPVAFWTHWISPSKKKVSIVGTLWNELDYKIKLENEN